MSTVGQIEKITQHRVIDLFKKKLGYAYLGDWKERADNRNIESRYLSDFLKNQGYDDLIISKALFVLEKAAGDQSKSIFDRNKEVYQLLRYGVKVKPELAENSVTVFFIDWANPLKNNFAIAEEVTLKYGAYSKRPDVVVYVNGIALGVLELKRSTVSISEGIRQNLDNQKKEFIQGFFSTIQFVFAGNDSEGLRYGTLETKEKYYLTWKELSSVENLLDRDLLSLCDKTRFLEMIHDFIIYDKGVKKLCRHNQYFGVQEAQKYIRRREGGIIWHTQGSGKSLTMVWLAKWIRENIENQRVLIITDRTELDEQIEKVFKGVNESIYRTSSGEDLISTLNSSAEWLICSLIHKFGGKDGDEGEADIEGYVKELQKALPANFKAKGEIFVFVDECHRTQGGALHDAMKAILPNAVFIGFTGTPLLKADKMKSVDIFGKYIHTYKFNEAVRDGVVLDLRYEARDIDQNITSQTKIDQWFDLKTKGLTDIAKAQLKQRWGTMQKVLSSQSRLEKIVADILLDMELKDRLRSGNGNAMLVSGSIYQACKFYELFSKTDLAEKCAIVTSYKPSAASIKGEESGEGVTEKLRQYDIYKKMLARWFNEAEETAIYKSEEFEKQVKKKFVDEPGQMKLLIVVDKLLTGFDAPSATYLYIDKEMRDHGLFQAICRVNRLDDEDKEYGYIIDYKDLFESIEDAVEDYTTGALSGYDKDDVAGLLKPCLEKSREKFEENREMIKALCEPVREPKRTEDYLLYFCAKDPQDRHSMKESEPRRLALYKFTASLLRSYSHIANNLSEAGYSDSEIVVIKNEIEHFEKMRTEVKLASGDYINLKMYEPAMRHLIDSYIRAEESEKISAFDDLSLVDLIIKKGEKAINDLPDGIKNNKSNVAEAIENNLRRLIVDETPINPKYYEKMSDLLDALIEQRKKDALDYQKYLQKIIELSKQVKDPTGGKGRSYPASLHTQAMRSLYDNLGKDESLAVSIHQVVLDSRQDEWRSNALKVKKVLNAIKTVISDDDEAARILELVKNQNEY